MKPVFKQTQDTDICFKKYRKRPVIVEAAMIGHDFEVQTLEGIMRGKPMDYLIRGIAGELYICDRSIFQQTYDIVEDEE